MPLNVQKFMKYYLREVRFLQLESMTNSQTIFGYFRTFCKNDFKLQKSVAMVTKIKFSDIFLNFWIISCYMIYNTFPFKKWSKRYLWLKIDPFFLKISSRSIANNWLIKVFFFKIITTHRLFPIRISYCSGIRINKMHPCDISYHNKVLAGGTFFKKKSG